MYDSLKNLEISRAEQ